jgi:hypothetical protein
MTIKEFILIVVHVKMQRCHLYIVRHVTRVVKAVVKHDVVHNDMV